MADILTPTLGESVTEATIARWTKKPGDAVRKDEVLVELDTDKVSLEVASPADGVLAEILTPEGATVTPQTVLGRVSEGAAASARPSPRPLNPRPRRNRRLRRRSCRRPPLRPRRNPRRRRPLRRPAPPRRRHRPVGGDQDAGDGRVPSPRAPWRAGPNNPARR